MKILKPKTKKPIDYRYLLVSETGVNKCFIKTFFWKLRKNFRGNICSEVSFSKKQPLTHRLLMFL